MFSVQYSPYTLPLLLDALLCGVLAAIIWRRRRPNTGVMPFMLMFAGLIWWTVCNAAVYAFRDFALEKLFEVLLFIGVTAVPAAWFAFILVYSGHDTWLTRRVILLLLIEPLLVLLVSATNPLHHLFWSSITSYVNPGGTVEITTSDGLFFWLHAIYSYLLILTSVVLMIRAIIRYPSIYRGQAITVLIGLFIPWAVNIYSILTNTQIDLTPFAFTLACLAFGWSLLRFRLFNIVPVARESIIESLDDGVFVVDQQARLVDINPAARRIMGIPATTPIFGKLLSKLIPEQAEVIARFRPLAQAQAELTDPRNGNIYELHMAPLFSRDKTLTGRVVTLHDITTLKKTNQELLLARQQADDANALKSQFLATVSHELRTPLSAIVGYAQLMAQGVAGPLTPEQNEYQARIMVNAKHLLALINDVLDLSKIEAGHMLSIEHPFNLRDVLGEVMAQGKVLADQKKLALALTIDAALPATLIGDDGKVQQIVLNLVSNAIKFTDVGQITVEARRASDQTWQVSVTDTGIGIAPENFKLIFDEFRQIDHGFTRKYGGTGLGLSIVKRLVTLMNGDVQVTSIPNAGSTFTVTLPLHISSDQPQTAQSAAVVSQPDATVVASPA